MFNPYSAFPRQTTYTPYARGGGIQQAVNAPHFGNVGTGGGAGYPSLQGAYMGMAQRQAMIAQGAAGHSMFVRGMEGRDAQGPLNNFAARQHAGASRTLYGQAGHRPLNPFVNQMNQRAAGVIEDSGTPISMRTVAESTTPMTPLGIAGRPAQEWDNLLSQPEAHPQYGWRRPQAFNEPLTAPTTQPRQRSPRTAVPRPARAQQLPLF